MKKRRLRWFIARHRRSPIVRWLAEACHSVIRAYENFEYHPEVNGELFVLRALAGRDFRVIFDVGANVGRWALLAHESFPDAAIHCFEVMPSTAAELRRRTDGMPWIIVRDFGLADREGAVSLNHFPDNDTLTSITEVPHRRPRIEVQGRVTTGDAYLEREGIQRVDFLKIDVEGAEHLVLQGFRESIAAGRIGAIQFEYGRTSILTKFLLRDFHAFFEHYGWRVGKIFPNYVDFRSYEIDDEDFIGPNFLAVSPARFDSIRELG